LNERGGKLKDIRDTASDAVEILRELGTPGVQESLDKAKEIAIIAKEIMETMKTPEWRQNLENIQLISQNMNSASSQIGDAMKELKETGVIEDAQQLIKSAKTKLDFLGEGGIGSQDLRELSASFKEMLQSIKGLTDELKLVAVDSRRSGTLKNVEQTIKEASDAYRTVTEYNKTRVITDCICNSNSKVKSHFNYGIMIRHFNYGIMIPQHPLYIFRLRKRSEKSIELTRLISISNQASTSSGFVLILDLMLVRTSFLSLDIAANCDEYADATPSTNFSVKLNINFSIQLDHSKQYSQQYHQYDDA